MYGAFRLFHIGTTTVSTTVTTPVDLSQLPTLQIKHGPNAGKNFTLNKLPCFIGRDPINEIRLDDPHIISQHVKIFEKDNGYYLMDLGGETFINGQPVRGGTATLKSGDVVRLGKSALLVFGS
jgi:pSer/pThr/pTyr-binding forkhead associated (FHA) protein